MTSKLESKSFCCILGESRVLPHLRRSRVCNRKVSSKHGTKGCVVAAVDECTGCHCSKRTSHLMSDVRKLQTSRFMVYSMNTTCRFSSRMTFLTRHLCHGQGRTWRVYEQEQEGNMVEALIIDMDMVCDGGYIE